jgi:hypothetical protein
MSNYRLVFIPQKPNPHLQSFEIPLSCVHDYSFQQPMLGANRLNGKVYAISGGVEQLSSTIYWTVFFNTGGFGTFVPLFYQLATYAARYRPNFEHQQDRPAPPEGTTTTAPAASFFSAAYIDPCDPSTIILTQPTL